MSTERKDSDTIEVARSILEELLTRMGVEASVSILDTNAAGDEDSSAPITLNIEGDDLGVLIGRRGHTLSCLQFILRLILTHRTKAWLPLVVDIEGYKQERFEKLSSLAVRLAKQVKTSKQPFTLEPMPAYERRIIHLTLADHNDVRTESTGTGEARKVVIVPK
ncbi:MAG: R3H domain-containing nucleic acid-binding protein [Dehalococcoidales bacterium]